MRGNIIPLEYSIAKDFILPKHYSGRVPNIIWAFGWYIVNTLVAVCTFGKPASNSLCEGICGKEYSKNVYELNRLCRVDELNEQLSSFVSACLRRLSVEDLIIVSYSDTQMNHHGYIYQACNFLYTGCTKGRTDFYNNGGHSRHGSADTGLRQYRYPKHRYVFFCTRNKKLKRSWSEHLSYSVCKYPKGDNSNYVLGNFISPKIVSSIDDVVEQ